MSPSAVPDAAAGVLASRDLAADPDGPVWTTRLGWWGLIRRRAEATPDRLALLDDRGRRLTFAEYRDAAERVAAGFQQRGIRPGDSVAWQLPTTLEAAVTMAALARLGTRQAPLLPVLRRAEMDVVMGALEPRLLITPRNWAGFDHGALAAELGTEYGCDVLTCDLPSDELALPIGDVSALPDIADEPADNRSPAWVFFTSGTTGRPKGVLHSDASVIAASNAPILQLKFAPDDLPSIAFPFAHIGGPGLFGAALRCGCGTMLVERWDPRRTPYDLARAGVTLMGSAVPFFNAYLAAQREHGSERLFSRLNMLCSGGAPLPAALQETLLRELGGDGVFNGYGLTECPMIGFAPREKGRTVPAGVAGPPAPGVDLRIVGPDEQEMPPGQEGEVRLRGPQLFAGYVDDRDNDGALDAQGFVRTGDLGVLEPDGNLRITGRLKEVIIRNAENISAVEVEGVLTEHPSIVEAAAVGVPDERTGERCCAFVVLAPGAPALTLAELIEFFRARDVAKFKIPEQLEILPALPRNAMGKVLKQQLRKQVEQAATA
ncbi:MAG TPA: class I adenylate-forming enzyme family protein [Mycobacteriales bacterium]|nr:class I adenylate-forming enzyme family protein [Mycobacteriales bacterium]